MKLTESRIKRIIQEELANVISEGCGCGCGGAAGGCVSDMPEPEPDMFADIDPEMPTEDMIRWHAESIEELFENITRNSMGDGEIG